MYEQETLYDDRPPPYARPTMDEVRAVESNGLTVVGSFSGCGGSSLGLRMAGFSVPLAVEFIPEAVKTYKANAPGTIVLDQDIREIEAGDILRETGLKRGELDVFEGSPPCSSFSTAGKRQKGWGEAKLYSEGVKQRTDDLFDQWLRLLRGLYPRSFVAENVPGMIDGAALGPYAQAVTNQLSTIGYRVQSTVLNSANYGVPQDRSRLIFLGVRHDQVGEYHLGDVMFPESTTKRPHTLRQALESVAADDPDHAPFLPDLDMRQYAVGKAWEYVQRFGTAHLRDSSEKACFRCGATASAHAGVVLDAEDPFANVRCTDGEPAELQTIYFMLTVPDLEKPCPTLTATAAQVGAASVTHPTEPRKFSPAECKAICGFPTDFVLTGTAAQRIERMGRAVTPPLYEAIGRQLTMLLSRKKTYARSA